MLKDKRRKTRKVLRHTAWLTAENYPLHGCVVADISDSGAKLDVENAGAVPDQFVLLLSKRQSPRRLCRVIWRAQTQIGVHFEKSSAGPVDEGPPLVPFLSEPVAPAELAEPAEKE